MDTEREPIRIYRDGHGNMQIVRPPETFTRSDRAIKTAATRREYRRFYHNFCLPPRDIWADCRDGRWVRRAWASGNMFGWSRWKRADCREGPEVD